MSALFYRTIRTLGRPILAIASRSVVLHAERVPRTGACLLAANHQSVFDPVLLIATTPRIIHWLSIVELFQKPWSRWFFTGMCAHPLDRSRPDSAAVRTMLRQLRAGEMVGIFPQGEVVHGADSALEGHMPDSVARLVQIARVPLIPCLVLGGRQFRRWPSWLPLRRTRWTVAYGHPIALRESADAAAQRAALLEELGQALRALSAEVNATPPAGRARR